MKLFFVLSLVVACQAAANYENYEAIRVKIRDENEEAALQHFIEQDEVDLWRGFIHDKYDMMVPKYMADQLRQVGFDVSTMMTGEQLQQSTSRAKVPRDEGHVLGWENYHELDVIDDYVQFVADTYSFATATVIGRSEEGRDINMLTISNGPDTENSPIILVDGGIHAREWISPAVTTYLIHELLETPDLLNLNATFAFIPVLNVDGYVYSWTDDRFWRKTRSYYDGNACIGTDANRNFDFQWTANTNTCGQTYAGPNASSEQLTQALSQYMTENTNRIQAYLTMHSYGLLMLHAYGYTPDPPENEEELKRVAQLATDALAAVYGTQYDYGSSSEILYSSTGTSRDYAAGVPRIPYVYTIELRDEGEYGFDLPEDQILPTSIETWELYRVVVEESLAAMQKK